MFIVFDLDGTLCNIEHRLHFIDRDREGGPDWRSFFAACIDDKPIPHMIENLKWFYEHHHRVEIWSGRSDEVRQQTYEWLKRFGVSYHVRLIMRKAGDSRPDDVVKKEWLNSRGWPDLIVDDRKRVVDMWRAERIPCLQIAPGDV